MEHNYGFSLYLIDKMSVKIAIVEDIPMTREGLKASVDSVDDFECVGTFEDAETFSKNFNKYKIDVVLMDINLPGQSGIECISQLKDRNPGTQFLVVTNYEDPDKIFDALRAGATGYLLKTTTDDKLRQAIHEIYAGGSPMSLSIARKIVNSFSGGVKSNKLIESLTERERQVLQLLDKGYMYKAIADKLFISLDSVRTHIRKIYEKLHVHSRTEALNKVFPRNR